MKEKRVPLAEAAGLVKDGALLGLTTSTFHDAPMAFLRQLIRQGVRNLRVFTLTGGGLNIDLLLGAGVVGEYETASCSFGSYGPAPNFQRGLRARTFRMKDNT